MNDQSLPPHLRLHDLRRDAKNLLEAALDGDVPCLERFYDIGREPSLTAAQLVVARDHGFSSWAKLKEQVERNAADPRTEVVRQLVRRRDREPDDELGVVVPYEQVVATVPGTTVAVSAVRAYSDRCLIDLEGLTRSYVGLDMPRITGVRFADGRTSGGQADWASVAMTGVEVPSLQEQSARGGSHGGCRASLWPLPPPGELRLTISWPQAGIADGTPAAIDATPIQAAAARVRPFTLGSAEDDAAPEPDSPGETANEPETSATRQRGVLFGNLPEDHFYAVVPVDAVVARSSRLALAIHAVRVHRTGCLLDVEWISPRTSDWTSRHAIGLQTVRSGRPGRRRPIAEPALRSCASGSPGRSSA